MSIPREASRDTGDGILVSICPDVCLTPAGSSYVPIPYSITAKQSDDANTCPTVRGTGKRLHTMGSVITKCSGDAPGTGKGVKSGTVESVCHPKEHSSSVRACGQYVIRHNDVWHMNNKNTVGKLTYVKDTEVDQLTPPIEFAQAHGLTMTDASPSPRMAQAAVANPTPAPPSPGTQSPPPRPPGQVIYPEFEQWKQNQAKPPHPSARWWKYAKWGTGIGTFIMAVLDPSPIGYQHIPPWELDAGDPNRNPVLDPLIQDAQQDAANPDNDWWELDEWYMEQREKLLNEEAETSGAPQTGLSPETARVSRNEEGELEDCGIRPHSVNRGRCASQGLGQSHHGMVDFPFRTGTRSNPGHTAPGAPSLDAAYTVCVSSTAHSALHTPLNSAINTAGASSGTDTVPFSFIREVSFEGIDAIPDTELSPQCKELYKQTLRSQFSGVPDSFPLRGRLRPTQKMRENLAPFWGYSP